ncbi:hypothetical protein RhiirB3_434672 [Rhizophagus irregularis]|nr:hypothetical protein RhiirB3_434672 [Rhizophagus irregularis]
MVQSFNCYVLGSSDTFAIEFYNHEGTRYVTLGKHIYKLNIFKSGSILNYICIRNEIDETVMRKLKLWKVNVKKKEIKEKNISTEEDIVQELDGKEMEFQELFEEYFQDESNNKNFIVTNIHIITIIPVAGSLKEVLSVILPAKIETSSEIPEGQDLNYYNNNRIPLKERDTNNALGIFKNNVTGSFDRLTSKTNFNFFLPLTSCISSVLHIDEYQEIFAFEKWEGGMTEKELFKEMLYTLGPLMAESENRNFYVQTFLSGHKFRVANEIPIEYFKSNSPDCSRYSFNYQKEIKIEMTPNITEVYLDGLEIIKYYPAEISSLFLLNEQTTIEKEHVNFNVHTDITTLATPNTIALGIFTNIYLIAYVQDIGRKLKSKYELIPFVSGRTKNFTLEERIQNIENLLEEYYLNVRIF